MKIVYHKNCADGIMSAAIIDYKAGNSDADFVPVQPGQKFPLEIVGSKEPVFLLDYSIDPEEMDQLMKVTPHVWWFDHHKTAIDTFADYGYIVGERREDRCAAYLCWEYFFKNRKMPKAIEYVDDQDRMAGIFPESVFFKRGFLLYSQLEPTNTEYFKKLFEGGDKELQHTLDAGQILESNSDLWARSVKGYDLEFEGLRVLVLNRGGNSNTFRYIDDGTYDALMTWSFNGNKYRYSLYSSKKGRDSVDLSKIASKYGGGGHPNACGFTSDIFLADPRK